MEIDTKQQRVLSHQARSGTCGVSGIGVEDRREGRQIRRGICSRVEKIKTHQRERQVKAYLR